MEVTGAYSTTKIGAEQKFQMDEGGYGPLLRGGRRLELRWSNDVKKPKGRPGGINATSGREVSSVKFDVDGIEVGRFPTDAARTLVALLARRLVDVEARVGPLPPVALELGTSIPVVVEVSLRSAALTPPSQVGGFAQKRAVVSPAATKGKGKGKVVPQALSDETDQEVRRTSTAKLIELLALPRVKSAVDAAEPSVADAGDTLAQSTGPGEEGPEDEDEVDADMSCEAAAQLGDCNALERLDTRAMSMPKDIFGATLRRYQAQAVHWMWQQENPSARLPERWLSASEAEAGAEKASQESRVATQGRHESKERSLHPLWDEYELPAPVRLRPDLEECGFLYHHRTTGALSLDFPDASLAHCRGGILADDMGLGKTVMCLALIALDATEEIPTARRAAAEQRAQEDVEPQARKHLTSFFQAGVSAASDNVGGTLVVAPLSLITQWASEVGKHWPKHRRCTFHEYHGSGRRLTVEQLRAYDIVFTTYGTLSAEREDGPLLQVFWRRVVLDEAHSIKNRLSRVANVACSLRAYSRWAVSGTPLQNNIDELYALVRFLRVDPWGQWPNWRRAVSALMQKGDSESMQEAMDASRRIVQPLILRRTKATVDPSTGELLLKLPTKHVHVVELELSPAERDFYDALYKSSKTKFDTFVSSGEALNKYTSILQLILKLRQALCHPFLVFAREGAADDDLQALEARCMREMAGGSGAATNAFVGNLLEDIRKGELADCPICCDTPEDPAMTPCGHIFCRECAIKAIVKCSGECPVCRRSGLTRKSLRVLPGASRFPTKLLTKASGAGPEEESSPAAQSTKMRELLRMLRMDMAAGRRAVVFSQWTSFLDLVGSALEFAAIPWQRFDGSLSRDQRGERVSWLSAATTSDAASGRVLLVSLKAGGVGLNLVAASRLYLLDLWWNPAAEEQAIQRVHRIGQTSEVHVYKFVVSDSMDTGLLELQRVKQQLFQSAVSSGGPVSGAMKLGLDDLKRLFNPGRSSSGSGASTAIEAAPVVSSTVSETVPPAIHSVLVPGHDFAPEAITPIVATVSPDDATRSSASPIHSDLDLATVCQNEERSVAPGSDLPLGSGGQDPRCEKAELNLAEIADADASDVLASDGGVIAGGPAFCTGIPLESVNISSRHGCEQGVGTILGGADASEFVSGLDRPSERSTLEGAQLAAQATNSSEWFTLSPMPASTRLADESELPDIDAQAALGLSVPVPATPTAASAGDCFDVDDEEMSDSDLLAACSVFETQAPEVDPTPPKPAGLGNSTVCWEAMRADDGCDD